MSMKRKILVFTGTRAEYGILYWLLRDLSDDPEVDLGLLVSGSHLVSDYGYTIENIKRDGFRIDAEVDMLLSSGSSVGVAKSLGLSVVGYSDALDRLKPDLLIVLGDRYEALGVTQVAMLLKVPVAHIHGGEVTEGAYDDSIRHSISKMSHLHFVTNEVHRKRVIQLGEQPDTVFNVGALGLEHLKRTELLSLEELSRSIGFDLTNKFFLVTYHPVTLGNEEPESTFQSILAALSEFSDYKIVITYPNADEGGKKIIPIIEKFKEDRGDSVFVSKSLGQLNYLSAVQHCSCVVGNSSSGIIEVPSFKKGTVDVGCRQKGRIRSRSVVHSETDVESIKKAVSLVTSQKFFKEVSSFENPYGDGFTSRKIIDVIKSSKPNIVKHFFDINY